MRSRNITAAIVVAGIVGLMPAFAAAAPGSASGMLSTSAADRAEAVSAPVIDAPATVVAATNQPLSISANATDSDAGDLLTISASGGPASLTLNHVPSVSPASATLSGTPASGEEGSYSILWSVTDGMFSASTTTDLTVEVNTPPVVVSPATASGFETVALSFAVAASDPDGDAITSITAAGLPGGATFTPNALLTGGSFNWTPPAGSSASSPYTVSFEATSGVPAQSGSASTVVSIGARDTRPVVVAPGTVNGRAEILITFNVTASDPEGQTINSLIAQGTQNTPLPPGATFTPNATNTQGTFSWIPGVNTTVSIDFYAFSGPTNTRSAATVTKIVVAPNRNPVVTAPATVSGSEGTQILFNVTASDPDGEALASLSASGLPLGASFTAGAGNTSGTFDWTPSFGDAGSYAVVFTAANAHSGSATTQITVGDVNRAPTANAGGPYTGVVNVAVAFDGSASSDPDGNALTYAWDFGDASTGTGVNPGHAYLAGGTYAVSLVVTDNGMPALSSAPASASAEIASSLGARVFTTHLYKIISLLFLPRWCVQIEPVAGNFQLSDVNLASIKAEFGGLQISAIAGKTSVTGDTDRNGVAEIAACFARNDLRTLFRSLPFGLHTVTLNVMATTTAGAPITGTVQAKVFSWGGLLAAQISPNPLNPEGTMSFATKTSGNVRVRLFDASGRFVRTLADGYAAAGYQDIRIDGKDARGNRLNTGVYFYRAETPDGAFAGRFTVLK